MSWLNHQLLWGVWACLIACTALSCTDEKDPPAPTLKTVTPAGSHSDALTFYQAFECRQSAPAPGIFTDARLALGIDFSHTFQAPDDQGIALDFGGIAVADLDGDDFLDLFFANSSGTDRLYLTGGRGPAKYEPTQHSAQPAASMVVSLADMDGDGDRDAIVGGPEHYWLENDGKGAMNTAHPLPVGDVSVFGYSAGDLDGDERLDLYVAVHEELPVPNQEYYPEKSQLLHNTASGWKNISDKIPNRRVEGSTFLVSVLDLDDDGDLDLYEVNDAMSLANLGIDPNDHERPGNQLYRNDGQMNFTDVSTQSGADIVLSAMGAAVGDYDNDGLPDIYVTSMLPEPNVLLHNDGQMTFSDVTDDADAHTLYDEHDVGWGAIFADTNSDGWLDLYVLHGWHSDAEFPHGQPENALEQRNIHLRNLGDGTFVEDTAATGLDGMGWSRSPVLGDLNRDGFPDLIVSNSDGAPNVYVNGCNDQPWMTVILHNRLPNRDAVGAKVSVTADGVTQTRHIMVGSDGLHGSSAPEAYFGFPTGTSAATLSVRWPDGSEDTHTDVPTRHIVRVRRQ